MTDDYTPTKDRIVSWLMEGAYTGPGADHRAEAFDAWIAEHDAKVRAEEREQANREPSDAAVEAAARAMAHADVTNPDGWVMSEEARNVYSDMARAALIAAQEVRDES